MRSLTIDGHHVLASTACSSPRTLIGRTIYIEVTDGHTLTMSSDEYEVLPDYSLTDKPPWLSKECVNEITAVKASGVMGVGAFNFYGMTNLKTVGMEGAFGDVGESAFEGCINLESITDDAIFTTFRRCACFGCSKLATIDLQNAMQYEDSCFEGCSLVTGAGMWWDYVWTVGNRAFAYSGMVEARAVNLGRVKSYAFYHCRDLVTVSFGELAEVDIETGAFAETMITSLEFPALVGTIAAGSFENCTELVKVTYMGADPVYEEAFVGCVKLTIDGLSFPNGYDYVNFCGFSFCNFSGTRGDMSYSMEYNTYDLILEGGDIEDFAPGGETPWKFCLMNIKKLHLGKNVRHIGAYAFEEGNLVEIVGQDVKSIGRGAFRMNHFLSKLNVPLKDMTYIGSNAFEDCTSLEEVELPLVKTIPEYAFAYCSGLKRVKWNGMIGAIEVGAFYQCVSLDSNITFAAQLGQVSQWAFEGCLSLTSISFPELTGNEGETGLTQIDRRAFYRCSSLEEIKLPSTLKKIGEKAFEGAAVVSLVIPEYVTFIGTDCFKDCGQLQTVKYYGVTVIGNSIFAYCPNLTSIIVANDYPSIRFGGRSVTSGGQLHIVTAPERVAIALSVFVVVIIVMAIVSMAVKGKFRCRSTNRNTTYN